MAEASRGRRGGLAAAAASAPSPQRTLKFERKKNCRNERCRGRGVLREGRAAGGACRGRGRPREAAPFHAPLAEVHSEVGKENEKTAALGAAGKRARRGGEAPPKTMKAHLNLDAAEGESWATLNLE